jgi:peptidoglycan/LPS O-acetylase OafA/YrhL
VSSSEAPLQKVAESKTHVPELDGVRGLAIAGVMALHFMYVSEPRDFVSRLTSQLSGYGLLGVDLFFVLSGFLITGILYDAKGADAYFRNFYMRRTLRIFPLYFAVLLLLIVFLPATLAAAFDPQLLEMRNQQGWLWTYLTNVYVGREGEFSIPYVSHFWSLAVEEHFYLFWPLLVAYLSRRGAMVACGALSLLALGLRVSLSSSGHVLYQQVLTPCRLDTLCIGAFFALAARGPLGLAGWGARAKRLLPLTVAAVVALSVVHKLAPHWDPFVLEFRASVLALVFALVIVSAADDGGVTAFKRTFRWSWLRFLGKYSYGLYVFHGIIAYAFERKQLRTVLESTLGSQALATLVQGAAGVALSLLIAIASYELFEIRFLTLKRLFQHGRPRRKLAAGTEYSSAQLGTQTSVPPLGGGGTS